jgi:hypothetical protein
VILAEQLIDKLLQEKRAFLSERQTKKGKYGTLWLYQIKFVDSQNPGLPPRTDRLWAYSGEHAAEKFYDSAEFQGYLDLKILSMKTV